jgi:uncharacterized protein (DUF169 family)
MNHFRLADDLQQILQLRLPPIAIAFVAKPPEGVQHVDRPAAAGCAYWKQATQGRVFYTEASDHHGCPVGAHTHAVALPDAGRTELQGLIGTMVGLEYLSEAEIPSIPTRRKPFTYAVYAPLARTPVPPDAVLLAANCRQMMLLQEAAQSAGLAGESSTLSRPTCAVVPQTENTARTASSFGCVGNRVYTGLPDDEAYFAIPGAALEKIVTQLHVVARANTELEAYHRGRLG